LIPELELFEARVIGGGARSAHWNQIKADVLGVPYQPLQGNEFGSWGSAMIAGKAAGIFDDLTIVAREKAIPEGDPLQPNPKHQDLYRPLIDKYIRLQAVLRDTFVELEH
jgi:sugar (pentulose or hexulose) kinase